jgi:hypothetical protein
MKLEKWCDELICMLPAWTQPEIDEIIAKYTESMRTGGYSEKEAALVASNEIFDKFAPLRGNRSEMKGQINTWFTKNRDPKKSKHMIVKREEFLKSMFENESYCRAWIAHNLSGYSQETKVILRDHI